MPMNDTRASIEYEPQDGPYSLNNNDAYQRWRDDKLAGYPMRPEELVVEVADPRALTPAEHEALLARCRKTNMAIYVTAPGAQPDKEGVRRLGAQFGLRRLDPNMLADDDGITSLQVVEGKFKRGFIPYSNRRILWHTDGYYNAYEQWIRGMLLHCVSPAAEGGENRLLDHEIIYLQLRDANPEHVRALMAPDAMTIPANSEEGANYRGARSGPVFSVDEAGNLHMRYTARTRSIQWKDDEVTRAAVAALEKLLAEPSPYVFQHKLTAGQGVLCNNVLHDRTAFEDKPGGAARLLYRARYYDRIAGTDLNQPGGEGI